MAVPDRGRGKRSAPTMPSLVNFNGGCAVADVLRTILQVERAGPDVDFARRQPGDETRPVAVRELREPYTPSRSPSPTPMAVPLPATIRSALSRSTFRRAASPENTANLHPVAVHFRLRLRPKHARQLRLQRQGAVAVRRPQRTKVRPSTMLTATATTTTLCLRRELAVRVMPVQRLWSLSCDAKRRLLQ